MDPQRDDAALDTLALARRFEPVLKYTRGELFLPMSAERYVSQAALFRRPRGDDDPELVVPAGGLDLDTLAAQADAMHGQRLELHFVTEPLRRAEYRRWRRRPERVRFEGGSRFAVVGLLGRIVDAIMRMSLVVRGKVPGGFAAAADIAYRETGASAQPAYHVRATRDAGYLVLQYWFCYAMNDWRSTFAGVNDHEADWEQITLFLVEPDDGGAPELAWVAFSSHDEVGDDLRRRVDDPDLELVEGTHPVVYAGAGSHSGAYLPGDYVVTVAPPAVDRWVGRWYAFWGALLPWTRGHRHAGIGIPFIDYRRGDGEAIGPGTGQEWTPVVIDDSTPWVAAYRGLWGYDTRDPLGGERAPAGPRYERNGTVRPSWERPVAWAGLDKQPPTRAAETAALQVRAGQLEGEISATTARLDEQIVALRAAFEGARAVAAHGTGRTGAVAEAQAAVDASREELGVLRTERDAVAAALASPLPPAPVHDHLRHRSLPDVDATKPAHWVLRAWSTVSVSVLLMLLAAVVYYEDQRSRLSSLIWVFVLVLGIDAAVRRRFKAFLATAAVILISLNFIWLLVVNFRIGTTVLLVAAALALLLSNITSYLRRR